MHWNNSSQSEIFRWHLWFLLHEIKCYEWQFSCLVLPLTLSNPPELDLLEMSQAFCPEHECPVAASAQNSPKQDPSFYAKYNYLPFLETTKNVHAVSSR